MLKIFVLCLIASRRWWSNTSISDCSYVSYVVGTRSLILNEQKSAQIPSEKI
jgi:hypothetical protein